MTKRVLIVQSCIKQYREAFFRQLHDRLAADGVALTVAYGTPSHVEAAKGDNVALPDKLSAVTRNYWLLGERLLFQPLLREVGAADLVIIEHANKHLLNYPLLVLQALRLKKVAFWGHGYNRQGQANSLAERFKRLTAGRAGWWFTYTAGTKAYLVELGIRADRITDVQNSIDTAELRRQLAEITEEEALRVRQALGIRPQDPVGLFCGALYSHKRWDLLIAAARQVRERLPNFHLVILGDGPDAGAIASAIADAPWIHAVGPCFGADKARYFRMATVCLNPGLIGLAILDAFSAGLPVLTTDLPLHSPEIEYLLDGVNGAITVPDSTTFAERIAEVLEDPDTLEVLRSGARTTAERYGIEAMVDRFRNGILAYLETL